MEDLKHTHTSKTALQCSHCGEKVVTEFKNHDDEEHVFCCTGCRAVFNILASKGLEEYYDMKEKGPIFKARGPIKENKENFRYMDSSEFEEEFVQYNSETGTKTVRFYLEGIHCLACLWLLEKLPEFKKGITQSRLEMSDSVLSVTMEKNVFISDVAKEIADLGYPPHPLASKGDLESFEIKENRKDLSRIGVAAFCSMNIMLYAVSIYGGAEGALAHQFAWVTVVLSLPVLFYSAIPFYKSAWSTLKKGTPSIDQPVVLAILVGSLSGVIDIWNGKVDTYFDSLSVLVFLLLFSRYILKKAQKKGLDSSLAGSFFGNGLAHRFNSDTGQFEDIYSRFLKVGDNIKVMPGEIFPADGDITKGQTSADLSLLSGESTPINMFPGTPVFNGTVNLGNPVEVRVSYVGQDSRLGQILEKIQQDRSEKSPLLSTVDRLAHQFIVAIFIISAFVLGINWYLYDGAIAITRTLSLVIVTCPCALALATPLALSRSLNLAAKAGIIIKTFDVLERVARSKSILFDKTGTITYGTLSIDGWKDLHQGELSSKDIIYSLEKFSNHPIGKSLTQQLGDEGVNELPVSDFIERSGLGVSGTINGISYQIKKIEGKTGSYPTNTIGLYGDEKLLTIVSLKDTPRHNAKRLIQKLKDLGKAAFILSGDSKQNVARIGSAVGIETEKQFSEFSPEDKHELISQMPDVMMVGDGANDAMALQKANVGVAVSGSVEVSLRAADVYLTTPGLEPLTNLVELSNQTLKLIKRNLVISVVYNLLGATLAALGYITPLSAAILMPISSFTVLFTTLYGTKWLRHFVRQSEVTL
ncbi:MAG: cadmium-translocating P-type ATPase [Deltaproteobacteria bacterium]|nr:MAG: cadmium-translocating P-type ATPase [Deltaproteobacteria bacterium]